MKAFRYDRPSTLAGAVSSFDCVVEMAQDAGSHVVIIGRVVHVTAGGQEPLAHSRRSYCTTAQLRTISLHEQH